MADNIQTIQSLRPILSHSLTLILFDSPSLVIFQTLRLKLGWRLIKSLRVNLKLITQTWMASINTQVQTGPGANDS